MAPTLVAVLPVVMLLCQLQGASAADPIFVIRAEDKAQATAQSQALAGLVNRAAAAPGSKNDPCPALIAESFEEYKALFSKTYANPAEEMQACNNFGSSLQQAAKINMDSNLEFWHSINQYSDMSFEEFTSKVLMPPRDPANIPAVEPANKLPFDDGVAAATPSSYDHRSYGVVGPVKDQGQCGSCWAFAAIGVIESAYMLTYGGKAQFSDGQIVQCLTGTTGYGSQGCNGGWSDEPIDYASKNSIMLEVDYPYPNAGGSTGSCKSSLVSSTAEGRKVRLASKSVRITDNSYTALMAAVYRAPTTVYFEVINDFYNYGGGVYNTNGCGSWTNHAMVLVGYNEPSGYWIIKNSWGTSFGINGYIHVRMVKSDNSVGLCRMYEESYAAPLEFSSTLDGASVSPSPPSPPPPKVSPPPPPKPPKPPGGKRDCKNRGATRRYCYVWARKYKYCRADSIYQAWMHYYCARACKCPNN